MFTNDELTFESERLRLEPVRENHASTLQRLFWDPELYRFVPQDPTDEDELRERCQKWAKRISPDGEEIWLNWIAYFLDTEEVVAHFQATIKKDKSASIAYLVPHIHQKKGYASEGVSAMIEFLKNKAGVELVSAFIDTRNSASVHLVEKLGMKRMRLIEKADFFKGAQSDEWVYEIRFS